MKVYPKKLGTIVTLCLQGRVVIGEMAALREAIERLMDTKILVLDLTRVNLIDAAGLGLLIELREQLRKKGIEFRLMNAAERISRIFEITRLNTVFEVTRPDSFLVNPLNKGVALKDFAACA